MLLEGKNTSTFCIHLNAIIWPLSSWSWKAGPEGCRWEQGGARPLLCPGLIQNKQQPYCLEMYLPVATDRDRFSLSPVFRGFAKCHQVCCWNWISSQTGCSKMQSRGLQPVNAPLERKGFRTKLWDLFRVEAESWGHRSLCVTPFGWVKAKTLTPLHRYSLTLGPGKPHSFPPTGLRGEWRLGAAELLHPGPVGQYLIPQTGFRGILLCCWHGPWHCSAPQEWRDMEMENSDSEGVLQS